MRRRLIATLVASLLLTGGVLGGTAVPAGSQATSSGGSFGAGVVRLSGAQEVPPADPDGRGVFAYIAFGKHLCYALTAQRIEPATMAHIHVGVRGVNGPIAIGLIPPTRGFSADCITTQADATPPPGDPNKLTPAELAAIIANPAGFYANVHNGPFPGGAIRGQLR
jgi:CHRD domain